MPNSTVLVSTLPDIDQIPEMEMVDGKPEVHCTSGTERHVCEIPTAKSGIDQTRHNRVSADIAQLDEVSELHMADHKPEVQCISQAERDTNEVLMVVYAHAISMKCRRID